jgi:type II secretory pathway pseudopilin PulG
MRIRCSRQTNQGMTLVEAVVVVFVIGFLVMLLAPALLTSNGRLEQRISCTNNQKQLGLAYKVWAGDNNDRLPMEVSVTNGGALEWINTPDAWKVYQVMSNELSTPKILCCPQDALHHFAATNFTDDLKNKLSYFIGINATGTNADELLSGDGNFLNQGVPVKPGLFEATSNTPVTWDTSRHTSVETHAGIFRKTTGWGNVGLADGSVQALTTSGFRNQIRQTGLATNRLFIP